MPQGDSPGSARLCPGLAVRLNIAELARRTGLHQPHLNRARRDLVEAGVLRETAVGAYEVVVDPAGYQPGTFLDRGLLKGYAAIGCEGSEGPAPEPARPKTVYSDRPKTVYPNGLVDQKPSISETGKACADQKPSISDDLADQKPSISTKNRLSRARGEDREITKQQPPLSAGAQEGAAAAAHDPRTGEPGEPPAVVPAFDETLPVADGPFDAPLDDVRRYRESLYRTFGVTGLCDEWWEHRRRYDMRAWWWALRRLVDRSRKIRELSYLAQVASDWKGQAALPPPGAPAAAARRGDPPPGQAESRGCEYCSGEGIVTVYHPRPDPSRRIPATAPADCVCPRGRAVREAYDEAARRRRIDFGDVLAGGVDWLEHSPDLPADGTAPCRPAPNGHAHRLAKKFSAD
jgi:hypothetical protein